MSRLLSSDSQKTDGMIRSKKRSLSSSMVKKSGHANISQAESFKHEQNRYNSIQDSLSSHSHNNHQTLRASKSPVPVKASFETSSHASEQEYYTYDSRFNDSNQLKTKGNTLFKERRFQQAITQYLSGLRIVDPVHFRQAPKNVMAKMQDYRIVFLLNISSSYYNMQDFVTAEEYSSEVLKINESNFKALYRKAQCHYELKQYEEGLETVKIARQIDPTSQELAQTYKKILIAIKENKEKLKQSCDPVPGQTSKKSKKKSSSSSNIQVATESQNNFSLPIFLAGVGLSALVWKQKMFPQVDNNLVLSTGVASSLFFGMNNGLTRLLGLASLAVGGAIIYPYLKK